MKTKCTPVTEGFICDIAAIVFDSSARILRAKKLGNAWTADYYNKRRCPALHLIYWQRRRDTWPHVKSSFRAAFRWLREQSKRSDTPQEKVGCA